MAVTIYRSTDGSAPVLTGEVDKLQLLLKACLVDGYGSKAAAGWTRPFSGVNKAAFLQGAKAGRLQAYMRIDDSGPGAGLAKEARIVGYETMTDVDTGVAPFPTAAQAANGLFIRKSVTADAVARAWIVAADHRTVHVFVLTGDTVNQYRTWSFGDMFSYVPGDQYGVYLMARSTENSGAFNYELFSSLESALATATLGNYVARGYTGAGGALQVGKHGDLVKAGTTVVHPGTGSLPYSNPADGKLWLSQMWIHEIVQPLVRGYVRGVYAPLHASAAFNDADTFSGTGPLAGKSFQIIKIITNSGNLVGAFALETSDTWDSD